MGADIHMFAERLNEDCRWEMIVPPKSASWASNYVLMGLEFPECFGGFRTELWDCYPNDTKVEKGKLLVWDDEQNDHVNRLLRNIYSQCNYTVFAILADVRNSEICEDDYVEPIGEPRGLPKDSCPEILEVGLDAKASWDYHSFSYVYVNEVVDYFEKHSYLLEDFRIDPFPDFICWLKDQKDQKEEDSVRLVFWFDN